MSGDKPEGAGADAPSPKRILAARGLHPKKRFGQNFLLDPGVAQAIAVAATTPAGGTVLEIGGGLGALTERLAARAARVVAIERDRDLVPLLRERVAALPGVEIVEGDALGVDWSAALAAGPAPRVVAGNLPYLVTGPLLERTTGLCEMVDLAVFMIQAEVAERLLAAPGSGAYGALTVFVRAAFDVRRLLTVRGGAFYPRPNVDSTVVVLTPRRPRRAAETPAFRAAVRAAFGQRRKTLRNAWRGLFGWDRDRLEAEAAAVGITLDARGETLDVEPFAAFAARAGAWRPRPGGGDGAGNED